MISCFLMGGLGNQLFQIFTTISLAISKSNRFVFLNLEILTDGSIHTTVRHTYWKTILVNLAPFLTNGYGYNVLHKEKSFEYNEINIISDSNDKILLHGYFQSYKYFSENFYKICRMIGLEDIKKSVVKGTEFTQDLLNDTVSLHFRIGDYKKIQQYHPIMTLEYYKKSLDLLLLKEPSRQHVLYFCEDTDVEDVNKTIVNLKTGFPKLNFIRASNDLSDWEQMILMSCCRDNIIANSSFSWWAAYFNTNPYKTVYYPSVWFGEAAGHDTRDLCPMEWNKIL